MSALVCRKRSYVDEASLGSAKKLRRFYSPPPSEDSSKVVQSFEKGGQDLHKENALLKEQLGVAVGENGILKRAVAIQHGRQKGFDDVVREVERMKEVVAKYEEQLRTLKRDNHALTMQLQQALPHPQHTNFTHPRFPPDVY